MIVDRIDKLAGRSTGIKAQVVYFVICGVLEGGVYAALLPLLQALYGGDGHGALVWSVVACAAGIACAVANYLSETHGYMIGDVVILRSIQERLGDHIVKLPLGWFTAGRAGELAALLERDLQMIMNLPGIFLKQLVIAVIVPACIAALFLAVDWRVFLAYIALMPALYVWSKKMAGAAGAGHAEEERSNAHLAGRVLEFVRAQPILRATGTSRNGWQALEDDISRDHETTVRTLEMTQKPITVHTLLVYASFGLTFLCATTLLAIEAVTPVEYLFVIVLALRSTDALHKAASQAMALNVCQNAIDASEEILAAKPLPETSDPKRPTGASIEFDDVRFSYDGARRVIDGVTLSCPEGRLTALVGPSGSGKTTLTRLIARFWDVDAGAVRIGGVDVRDMAVDELLGMISLVFQDVYLFDGTIEDNVRFGQPDATDEQVRRAARIARLDQVAGRLEDGWGTRVGEGGGRLSGGERQRVSIARALLKDAPIVLFDEATAALDAENEAAIVDAMHELARDRTVIVIAHRLSTIAEADQIAMLEDGRVTQLGSHEELLAQEGRYRSFWSDRQRAQGWKVR